MLTEDKIMETMNHAEHAQDVETVILCQIALYGHTSLQRLEVLSNEAYNRMDDKYRFDEGGWALSDFARELALDELEQL